jgi:hypothetical protein
MQTKQRTLTTAVRRLAVTAALDAVGREYEWATLVSDTLATVARALLLHLAHEETANGPLALADWTRPTVARRAGRLCAETRLLLRRAEELRAKVEEAARCFAPPGETSAILPPSASRRVPDFGELRREVQDLIADLDRHNDEEVGLVLQSVTTDLGAGD